MRLTSFLFFLVVAFQVNGQAHYICYFNDKPHADTSEYSLSVKAVQRKELRSTLLDHRDIAVYNPYLDSLKSKVIVKMTSRWLNAALVFGDVQEVSNLENLEYVDSVSFLSRSSGGIQHINFGSIDGDDVVLNQNILGDINEKGAGVSIAVFDGGFSGVNTIGSFQPLFDENRVVGYNIIDTNSVYRYHQHGTQVFSIMASTDFGITPEADYYLFTTEVVAIESRLEEFYWLRAAEMADSIGVDIINSSLGYNYEHDFNEEDYSKKDLDGNSSLIAKAASIAVEKGIVVVTTAGNEGEISWSTLTTPGDVESVITVGSVQGDLNRSLFSSVGPTADGRIKPDICARGGNVRTLDDQGSVFYDYGTSFSAPVITSICALILEHYPSYSPQKVKSEIIRLGHLYPESNSNVGYGAIDIEKLFDLVGLSTSEFSIKEVKEMDDVELYTITGKLIFQGKGKYINFDRLPVVFLGITHENNKTNRFKVVNHLSQGN